jgi:hypothetical protein
VGIEVKKTPQGHTLQQQKLIDKLLKDHWDSKSIAKSPLPTNFSYATNQTGDGDPSK